MKIGFIGSGFASRTMMSALKHRGGNEIVGVFGGRDAGMVADKERAQYCATLDDLLQLPFDAVFIGSPHDSHANYCERALQAGKHVLCEKPFVTNLQDGERIISCAKESNRMIAVNHFQRFRTPNMETKKAIDFGRIGKIRLITDTLCEVPMDKDWQRNKSSLGFLIGYGIHAVDRCLWWSNARAERVSASCFYDAEGVERVSSLMIDTDSDISIQIFTSDQEVQLDKKQPGKASFVSRIIGEKGCIVTDAYGSAIYSNGLDRTELGRLDSWDDFHSPERIEAYSQSWDSFFNLINGQTSTLPTAEEALHSVKVCLLAYDANRTGETLCL